MVTIEPVIYCRWQTPLLQKFYCFLLCLLGTLSDSARIFASMKGRIAEQPVGVKQTTLIKFVSFS